MVRHAGGYHQILFQRANAQSGLAGVIFTISPRECLPRINVMSPEKHQSCSNCVMDTTDSKITFDANGVCDHCNDFYQKRKAELAYG